MIIWNFLSFAGLMNCILCFMAIYIVASSGRIKDNFAWILFFLSVGLWAFGLFMNFSTDIYEKALFWGRFLNSIAIFISLFFIHAIFSFLDLTKKRKKELALHYFIITSYFLLCTTIFKNEFVKNVLPNQHFLYYPSAGWIYYFFPFIFAYYVPKGLLLIHFHKENFTYEKRLRANYISIAALIGLVGGCTTFPLVFGINFYPFGAVSFVFMGIILAHAITKNELLGISITISLTVSRILTYLTLLIIFVTLNFLFTQNLLPDNKFYLMFSSIFLIFACETYSYICRKTQALSDRILVKDRENYRKATDLLNKNLDSAADFDEVFGLLNNFFDKDLKLNLTGFYIESEVKNGYKNFKDNSKVILKDDLTQILITDKSFIEEDQIPLELNPIENTALIPFLTNNKLVAFVLLYSGKKSFSYRHYEIFDLLIGHIGVVIDRIAAYQKISLQKQQFLIEKAEALKSLAGSIAHELRGPLSSISMINSQVKDIISKNDPDYKKQILELSANSFAALEGANEIIDIILSDLHEKPINPEDFSYINIEKILPEILLKYGYKNIDEKSKIKLEIVDDFIFKASKERFTFILFNLLKNALYYMAEYPDSLIRIGNETRQINGKIWNVLYVFDNGPGIPANIIPKLFNDFFTSGKKEGTGLGLAFCKRNMKIFGGDIICESEFGNGQEGWTKFSLLLPVISDEEIAAAAALAKKKRVLFIDDQKTNLLLIQKKIEKFLPGISCDVALSGREAIELFKNKKYNLVLTDIEMPEMDGVKTKRIIKNLNQNIPVIAYSSLNYDLFCERYNLDEIADFADYLKKPIGDNILLRSISKHLEDYSDDFVYLGEKEQYAKFLQNKKIILADDQKMNLMMAKMTLKSFGPEITTANDGKEVVEIYKNSLDEKGKSSFDLIITDINMPPFNGDEAVKQIREIEKQNNIAISAIIPVIALSGNDRKEDIDHFFKCQINDYFVKGKDFENVVKVAANWLYKENLIEENAENDVQENSKINHQNLQDYAQIRILNHDIIKQFDKEDRQELLDLFLKNVNDMIAKIKQSLKDNNLKELLFRIHAIKGTSGNIGAEKLFTYAKKMEQKLKKENLSNHENLSDHLENLYSELTGEIKGFNF